MQFNEYIEKLQKNVSELKELWKELVSDTIPEKRWRFANLGDAISFTLAAAKFDECISELTECSEVLPDFESYCSTEEIGEVVFDGVLSASFLFRDLKELVDREQDPERSRLVAEIRSTLFDVMKISQELIMGE